MIQTSYAPNTPERTLLSRALEELKSSTPQEIHPYINGKEVSLTPTYLL